MGQLQDMMMRTQGVQGRASGANTPYGPPQSPPPMQPPPNQMASYGGTSGQNYASPGGQFAGQMDPEMLAQIIAMMQATMGQAPMGSPQQGPGADATINSDEPSRKLQSTWYRNYSIASANQKPIMQRKHLLEEHVDEREG
jgi:hypothetical protein